MEVPQQTPRTVTAAPPSAVTLPPADAVEEVMEDAAVVVTTAPPGVTVMSLPVELPSLFVALIL